MTNDNVDGDDVDRMNGIIDGDGVGESEHG